MTYLADQNISLQKIGQFQQLTQHNSKPNSGVKDVLHDMRVDGMFIRSSRSVMLQQDEVRYLLRYAVQVHEPDIFDNKFLHSQSQRLALHAA